MPRTCTICCRPDRKRIDESLLAGRPFRDIAGQTRTSKSALERHRAHVADLLAQAAEARDATAGDHLLDQLVSLTRQTQEILQEARQGKDHDVALKAIGRLESQVELQARLLGQLRDTRLNVHFEFPPEAAERVAAAFLTRRSPRLIEAEAKAQP